MRPILVFFGVPTSQEYTTREHTSKKEVTWLEKNWLCTKVNAESCRPNCRLQLLLALSAFNFVFWSCKWNLKERRQVISCPRKSTASAWAYIKIFHDSKHTPLPQNSWSWPNRSLFPSVSQTHFRISYFLFLLSPPWSLYLLFCLWSNCLKKVCITIYTLCLLSASSLSQHNFRYVHLQSVWRSQIWRVLYIIGGDRMIDNFNNTILRKLELIGGL